jgi:heme A synthase
VTVTACLLYWNAQGGGLVEQWYADYVGQDGVLTGSGKWRTEEGKAFQTVALLFGICVYPAAVLAAGLLIRQAVRVRRMASRLLCLAAALLALYALYQLEALGLLRAVSSA